MTKKHFEEFAREIQRLSPDDREIVAGVVATVASRFNPNFDVARFMLAAGVR